MAVRRIATRIAVEGEDEFRASITKINNEYKTLSSELKLVESQFKGQANTVAALEKKGESLSKMYDNQAQKVEEARKALENAEAAQRKHADAIAAYEAKIAAAKEELDNLKNSTVDTTEGQKDLELQIKSLNRGLEDSVAKEAAATAGVEKHREELNVAQTNVNNFSHALEQNSKHLEEARSSATGTATSIDEFGKATKKTTESTEKMADTTKDAVDAMSALLVAAGVSKAIEEVAEALWAAVEASTEFESAITGVFKTVDATKEQRAEIIAGITEMSLRIPTATSELAELAQTAGQLGIRTENILSFTETMANMGVATDLSGKEAAEAMARLANVMQTSQTDFDRMGSTIVALGNNFATTEPKIVEMAARLAGAGKTAGMTEADVFGIATALSSLGIEAQMGGSALSRVISSMQAVSETSERNTDALNSTGMSLRELELLANHSGEDFKELAISMGITTGELKNMMKQQRQLEDFAKVSGVSVKEFSRAFKEDAAGALSSFVMGLAELDEEGQSAVVTLDEMGIRELRMRDALLRTTNASDLFTRSIGMANEAWGENTALLKEANTFYGTTESQMKVFQNSVNALKVSVGDQFQPALRSVLETGQDVMEGLADFVEANPWAVGAVTALTVAVAILAGGLTVYTVGTKIAAVAQIALNTAMAANPAGMVALAIGAAVAAITTFIIVTGNATSAVDDMTTAASAMQGEMERLEGVTRDNVASTEAAAALAERYIRRLEILEKQGLKTKESQDEYKAVVEMLNALIPELNATINEQTGLVDGGTEALKKNTAAWKDNAIEQAFMDRRTGIIKANADAVLELEMNQRALATATAEGKILEEDYAATLIEMADALGITKEEFDDLTESGKDSHVQMLASSEQMDEIRPKYAELRDAVEANRIEQENLTAAIERGTEAVAVADTEISALENTMDKYRDSTAQAAEAQDIHSEALEKCTETIKEQKNQAEALIDEYNKAYGAAHENINKTMGLFNDMTINAKGNVAQLTDALRSQQAFMNDYAANMQEAARKGVDEGLVKSLSDGSKESAEYLAAISKASEKEITALNEEFARTQEGKDEFARIMAEAKTEFSERWDEMNARTEDAIKELDKQAEAHKNGAATALAYADGLRSELSAIQSVANEIASAVEKAMESKRSLRETENSHAGGLPYVPFDGYIAELHKGERVLTAQEAKAYLASAKEANARSMAEPAPSTNSGSSTTNNSKTINQTVNVYSPDPLTPSQIARSAKNALWGL